MADFNFYVNRQGIRGRKGEQGEQGFSPIISVKTQTANEYVLTVQNEDGSFDTPNLRGNAIANNGGTYIRYNPDTEEMYTGYADGASYDGAGEVQFATYAQLENGGAEQLGVTSMDVYDFVNAKISEADAFTFDKLAHTLIGGSNVTLTVDDENETITISTPDVDLSSCVKTTGDQTISGYKTFLNSPILKGITNSTLVFYNGNNDTEVASIQYAFDNNRFTISSVGGMYLQTTNNSINVDDILTSASLTNAVTTNTTQTITGFKTFSPTTNFTNGIQIPAATSKGITFWNSGGNFAQGHIKFRTLSSKVLEIRNYNSVDCQLFFEDDYKSVYLKDIATTSDIPSTANLADKDLSNLSTGGENRLHALKGYMDELEPLSDSVGYHYYINNLPTEDFDINKFELVGSPIISNTGIFNGGQGNNDYIQAELDLTNTSSFELYTPYFNLSDISIGINTIVYAETNTNALSIFTRSAGQVSWGIWRNKTPTGSPIFKTDTLLGLQSNTTYQLKMEYTGTEYNLYLSTNKGAFQLVDTQSNSTAPNWIAKFAFGRGNGQNLQNGYIDLSGFKFIKNGFEQFPIQTKLDIYQINNNSVTIPYIETIQGDKITDIQYLSDVQTIYNALGNCNEVVLDKINQVYYLPAGSVYGKINRLNNSMGNISTILDSINGEAI